MSFADLKIVLKQEVDMEHCFDFLCQYGFFVSKVSHDITKDEFVDLVRRLSERLRAQSRSITNEEKVQLVSSA